jgi:predicted GNAT family acetyltransferase
LRSEPERFELYVSRDGDSIGGHLGIFRTPEANYVSIGAVEKSVAAGLLELLPKKCVVFVEQSLYETIEERFQEAVVSPNDIMVVRRGEERLTDPDRAVRLSTLDAPEYSHFGTSFNVPEVPIEWVHERLHKDRVFGVFSEGVLASVASVAAWLPQMAVITGVETNQDFREKGFAVAATSAATREGLAHSESCMLFVRADNLRAVHIYQKLGYRKIGEELWVDVGTGLVP